MPEKTSDQKAIEGALKKRKELSDTIRKALQELEFIETTLKGIRKYSGVDSQGGTEPEGIEPPGLGRAGHGLTQSMFEHVVREILRERGEPMQSSEFVEAFRNRGLPIGGSNELKQAWNRLWQAKLNGVLVHFPRPGYWLADEPIPESNAVKNKAAVEAGVLEKPERKPHPRPSTGRPKGRPRALTEGQVETAKRWLLEGNKTLKEIATDLGGVAIPTLRNRLGDFLRELREQRRAAALVGPTKVGDE